MVFSSISSQFTQKDTKMCKITFSSQGKRHMATFMLYCKCNNPKKEEQRNSTWSMVSTRAQAQSSRSKVTRSLRWWEVASSGCGRRKMSTFPAHFHFLEARTLTHSSWGCQKQFPRSCRHTVSSVLPCHQTHFPLIQVAVGIELSNGTPKAACQTTRAPCEAPVGWLLFWYVAFGAQVFKTEEPKQLNPGGCSSAVTESSWCLAAQAPFPGASYLYPALDLLLFLREFHAPPYIRF